MRGGGGSSTNDDFKYRTVEITYNGPERPTCSGATTEIELENHHDCIWICGIYKGRQGAYSISFKLDNGQWKETFNGDGDPDWSTPSAACHN